MDILINGVKVQVGEFDGLPYDSQLERIEDGRRILDKTLNANVNIFAQYRSEQLLL